jgi:hypothetical protein
LYISLRKELTSDCKHHINIAKLGKSCSFFLMTLLISSLFFLSIPNTGFIGKNGSIVGSPLQRSGPSSGFIPTSQLANGGLRGTDELRSSRDQLQIFCHNFLGFSRTCSLNILIPMTDSENAKELFYIWPPNRKFSS